MTMQKTEGKEEEMGNHLKQIFLIFFSAQLPSSKRICQYRTLTSATFAHTFIISHETYVTVFWGLREGKHQIIREWSKKKAHK